jgi:hypothetical protein
MVYSPSGILSFGGQFLSWMLMFFVLGQREKVEMGEGEGLFEEEL